MMLRRRRKQGRVLRRGGSVALAILVFLAAIGVAALGLRLYLDRAAEGQLRPDEIIDFAARNSAGRSNVFAACPKSFCTPPGDIESPVFALSSERLLDDWREVIAAQRDVRLVAEDRARRRFTYIQRTRMLRFPDVVTVEFVALADGRSTLAIDSRSRYGKGDFGVNRGRVTEWLARLVEVAQQESGQGQDGG
jgi:uncharacterized protein (DUF1499 family)